MLFVVWHRQRTRDPIKIASNKDYWVSFGDGQSNCCFVPLAKPPSQGAMQNVVKRLGRSRVIVLSVRHDNRILEYRPAHA